MELRFGIDDAPLQFGSSCMQRLKGHLVCFFTNFARPFLFFAVTELILLPKYLSLQI